MKKPTMSHVLVLLIGLSGCAAAPEREVQSPRDAVTDLRAALVTMSDDTSARAVRLELERARTWLSEADTAITKEADPAAVSLLVELSRGQLVLVKSILERRKAEAALAQKSEEHRVSRAALESVQTGRRALDAEAEPEPSSEPAPEPTEEP